MSLLSYIARFPSSTQADLQSWYAHFQHVKHWEFIRQNVDRECARSDIDPVVWDDFLRDVAGVYATAAPATPLDPFGSTIGRRRSYFFLPGLKITPAPTLYRYMLIEHFAKFNCTGLPLPSNPAHVKSLIDSGTVTGSAMDGTVFGKRTPSGDYVVWSTDDVLATVPGGEQIRDRLALKHIVGGYLLELAYPSSLIDDHGCALRAPTILDASADDPNNWVFVKNRTIGGPDWGYTVDMTGGGACGRGVPEGVHAPFTIAAGEGQKIGLRTLTSISVTPPQLDHGKMLSNGRL